MYSWDSHRTFAMVVAPVRLKMRSEIILLKQTDQIVTVFTNCIHGERINCWDLSNINIFLNENLMSYYSRWTVSNSSVISMKLFPFQKGDKFFGSFVLFFHIIRTIIIWYVLHLNKSPVKIITFRRNVTAQYHRPNFPASWSLHENSQNKASHLIYQITPLQDDAMALSTTYSCAQSTFRGLTKFTITQFLTYMRFTTVFSHCFFVSTVYAHSSTCCTFVSSFVY